MSASFCLIPSQVDKFKAAIIDGTIDPEKLSQATSEERHNLLAGIVGEENAKGVNSLFESKLLLKDQQAGILRWAEKLAGVSPQAKRDMLSKIEKLDKVLSTAETDNFLHDLASTKLGIDVSPDEAKRILELTTKASGLREKGGSEYGHAWLDLQDYLDSITPAEKDNIVTQIGGLTKAAQATADLSAPFRQGRDYFGTKEWIDAFKRMFKYAGSEKAYRELNASIVGDRLYDLASKAKLSMTSIGGSVSKKEEQFISSWSKKIPIINNSERAYAGFLTDLRFNRFKNIVENLEKNGTVVTKEMARDLAGVINSGTGRGDLGQFEIAARPLAEAIWSPKMLKSRLDLFFNLKAYTKYSAPARAEQWGRLFRLAGTSVALIGMAKAAGADVELDPRSSNFGKVKVGKSTFDLTGGYGGYVRLLGQLATSSTKSTRTGEIVPLNTGEYGGRTSKDVIVDFLTGKQAPLLSVVNDIMSGKDFDGHDLTIPGAKARYLESKVIPLIAQDIYKGYQDNGLKGALSVGIPSVFGIGVQTNTPNPKTSETLTDTSNVGWLTRITGYPAPKPKPELQPLIKKLDSEGETLSLPASSTTITPPGQKDSRKMTPKELTEYKHVYQKNLINRLTDERDTLSALPSAVFSKRVDSIKRDITEQSKNELIRSMLR